MKNARSVASEETAILVERINNTIIEDEKRTMHSAGIDFNTIKWIPFCYPPE